MVEARKDTTVVIHSLTDHRRVLPIEKTGEMLAAHPNFLLVISYNPGYQSALKDLKPSTRQRFVTLPFGYPPLQAEATIIAHEGGVDAALAQQLALLGSKLRQLEGHGGSGQVGTRLLVYAAQLVAQGIAPRRAVEAAITLAVGGEPELRQAITELADVIAAVTPTVAAPPAAASMAEQKPALALFAQALAAGPVTLPPQVAWFANESDNRGAYRIAVMRQALAGHGDESLQAALSGRSVCWRRIWQLPRTPAHRRGDRPQLPRRTRRPDPTACARAGATPAGAAATLATDAHARHVGATCAGRRDRRNHR